jgi:hypothetical protein
MGDSPYDPLHVDFDRKIKLEFHGSTVTSDAGLLAYRELDDALALTSTAASGLHEPRTGKNTQHRLLALLRQSIYSRLAGYEDVNDAERLCLDPALRTVAGGRSKDHTAASASEMARFETETLSTKENLRHLSDLSGKWIDQAHQHRQLTKLILDLDSSVSETYGHQQGSAYNGYFECTCYHPLFLFNQFGDLEQVMLRRGNHTSATFWRRVLLPVLERYRDRDIPKYFRGDSAFALPKLLWLLEKEGYRYAIRLKANPVLERKIAHLLKRPVGRPSRKPKQLYADQFRRLPTIQGEPVRAARRCRGLRGLSPAGRTDGLRSAARSVCRAVRPIPGPNLRLRRHAAAQPRRRGGGLPADQPGAVAEVATVRPEP